MQTIMLDLTTTTISVQLPSGLDIDAVTLENMIPEFNTMNVEDIVSRLQTLGCMLDNIVTKS